MYVGTIVGLEKENHHKMTITTSFEWMKIYGKIFVASIQWRSIRIFSLKKFQRLHLIGKRTLKERERLSQIKREQRPKLTFTLKAISSIIPDRPH